MSVTVVTWRSLNEIMHHQQPMLRCAFPLRCLIEDCGFAYATSRRSAGKNLMSNTSVVVFIKK